MRATPDGPPRAVTQTSCAKAPLEILVPLPLHALTHTNTHLTQHARYHDALEGIHVGNSRPGFRRGPAIVIPCRGAKAYAVGRCTFWAIQKSAGIVAVSRNSHRHVGFRHPPGSWSAGQAIVRAQGELQSGNSA